MTTTKTSLNTETCTVSAKVKMTDVLDLLSTNGEERLLTVPKTVFTSDYRDDLCFLCSQY